MVTNDLLDFADDDILPNWWEIQYGLDPLNSSTPGYNSDSDWMTDVEEYFADTNPTNPASFLPDAMFSGSSVMVDETSTSRVYSIWWCPDLYTDSLIWNMHTPEITGTGSAISFPITDDIPTKVYRTGVRLP